MNLIDLMNLESLKSTCLLGESASPFIDEGDDLTSERERVRMLLSLVAHTGGYKMMVGAHNTNYTTTPYHRQTSDAKIFFIDG